jgi:Ethylbenzene dehydrogenase
MKRSVLFLGLAAFTAQPLLAADPATIDWSKIPAKSVKLFYPGQSSYDWLLSDAHKKGNKAVPKGRACLTCHEDDEANMGNKLVKAGPLEPTPLAGKAGTLDLAVQAAHDDKNLYLRFQWATQAKGPGDAYPHLRFDGKEWKPYGAQRLDKAVREGKMQAVYEDRLSLMIDDGKVKNFDKQGCWITCHNGMRDMPAEATKDQLAAIPLLQKRSDVRKYLPATRDENGTWDKTRSAQEIAKLKADGAFLDLIQWRAHRSNPVGMADDGYVLEYRLFDAGKNPFVSNNDQERKQPKMMFDAKKVGIKAHAAADIGKAGVPQVLLPGETAVSFDPNAGWKEGDMLPQYYVSRSAASGSAADNADARGLWKDGKWTVVWARPLALANADDKALNVGGAVTVGIAVHDDNVTTRAHHVSFPLKLGIGTKGDITAVTLK